MPDDYLKATDSDWFKVRITGTMVIVLIAFSLLFIRLIHLQVIQGKTYRQLSESNSIRLQTIDPSRGLIFDRYGELIVDNRPSFDLNIILKDAKPLESTVERLSQYTGIPKDQIMQKIRQNRSTLSYKPILLKSDIGRDVLAKIEAHKYELPGVTVNIKPIRHYLEEVNAAHLIGYLGEINTYELKSRNYPGCRVGDFIGKFGIEKAFEDVLRGTRGGRQVEVNAIGQVVNILRTVDAVPGNNLYLTIDARLQKRALLLMKEKVGAVIAMDPHTGQLLALVSSPTYDPNLFVSGMTHEQWSFLSNNPYRPMENKGVQGEYPPASVFKIISAIAGLEEGVIDEQTTVYCPGHYTYGDRTFRCWKRGGHGSVDIRKAIAESCDVFFYYVGQKLGIDRLAWHAKASGFGTPTGIRLDNEASGLVANSAWKKRRTGIVWTGGDTLSVAIGQGYNLATPLQVLVLTAAIANGGKRYQPRVLQSITSANGDMIQESKPQTIGTLSTSPKTLEIVREGMFQVVNTRAGTAWGARIKGIEMCGKTGTAQVIGREADDAESPDENDAQKFKDHAWFTAYAPAENPQIAVTVIVEHGEHGSSTAAPIAGDIISLYLSGRED